MRDVHELAACSAQLRVCMRDAVCVKLRLRVINDLHDGLCNAQQLVVTKPN